MNIDPTNLCLRIMPADLPRPAAPAAPVDGMPENFGESLRDAVKEIDNASLDARYKISNLIEGGGTDVHDTMIAVQKADLSFQLMLQVRNKVVQAYQQIAGMQF